MYMKLKILILLFVCVNVQAQNSISVAFQPCDLGIGLRFDRQPEIAGFYVSLTRGNYSFGETYIKNHIKKSFGFSYKNVTLGVNHHTYGETKGTYNSRAFDPISFEIGAKTHYKRLFTAIRADLIKGEGTIDIGLNF